MTINHRY